MSYFCEALICSALEKKQETYLLALMFVAGCHFEQPAVHVPTYHSLQMELIMASTEINSHISDN